MREKEIGNPWYNGEICMQISGSIRKSAMEKKDSRILAIASREIVAAKACYHRTCYKGYTRTEASNGASDGCGETLEDEYAYLESEASRQMLFDNVRSDVLVNEKIIRRIQNNRVRISRIQLYFLL